MGTERFYDSLSIDKSAAFETGFNPYYRSVEAVYRTGALIDGESYIDCASNDYLGLAADPRVKDAMKKAIDTYGASLCGTPIASGYARLFTEIGKKLELFTGAGENVIFPSCYQANCALFQNIVGESDTILVDHYAHASLIQGIRLARCKVKPFKHNDMEHLERLLKSDGSTGRKWVVTESVFSTKGSIAPLDRIADLCEMYDAVPVVDDSHGIGVIGRNGRGILEEKNIRGFKGIYTASLGKALANAGGIIAGDPRLIDYMKYSCPGLIYSTALTPSSLAGIGAVLDIIEAEFPARSLRLRQNRAVVLKALKEAAFTCSDGESPIVSVICGSDTATFRCAREFFNRKIFTTAFVPPSVPPGEGLIRIIAGAKLGENEISTITAAIAETGKEINE